MAETKDSQYGEIIDTPQGKRVIIGYTSKDRSKSLLITRELTEDEQRREDAIEEVMREQAEQLMEASPNAFPDVEKAKTYFRSQYNKMTKLGDAERQINELHVQRLERDAEYNSERIKVLSEELSKPHTEKERRAILAEIEEYRNSVNIGQQKAREMRRYQS